MKLRAAILAVFLFWWATPAFSQACSMCYSTAKATSKDGQRAISKGVVILLIPPVGFMTLGVWMAFRYARKRDFEKRPLTGTHGPGTDLRELTCSVAPRRISAPTTYFPRHQVRR